MLQVPLADAPITVLQFSGLLSEDEQGGVHNNLDKHIDVSLKGTHEPMAMAIKASAIASIVSRASIVWLHKLAQLISEGDKRALEGTNRALKAASFTTNATLDALTFCSRAMSSAAVARRGIWLCAWNADLRSKNFGSAYPFQGGNCLETI